MESLKNESPKVGIIIVNYNNSSDTIECIDSVKKKTNYKNYEIFVVDNKSTDNSADKLAKIKGVTFLKAKANGGFAKGNNLAIKHALKNGCDAVLLLNNDTVVSKNWLKNLLLKYDKNRLLSCRIMQYKDKKLIDFIGGKIHYFRSCVTEYHKGEPYENFSLKDDMTYTDFLTGCALLIPKNVIDHIGVLPEQYFMYYEDVDYSAGAKEHGFKLAVVRDSVIFHKGGASSGGSRSPLSVKYSKRNALIFIDRFGKIKPLARLRQYLRDFLLSFVFLLKDRLDLSKAVFSGLKMYKEYKNS